MNKEVEIKNKIKELEKEEKELLENSEVNRYINVRKMLDIKKCELITEQENNRYAKWKKIYNKCSHYYIARTLVVCIERQTCIFCGLTDSYDSRMLVENDDIIHRYLEAGGKLRDDDQKVIYHCDMEIANRIINRIKENNPNINNKTLVKYLEIALDNIIDQSDCEKRVVSRAKRLETRTKDIKRIRRIVKEDEY